jgi:hypothetical protein
MAAAVDTPASSHTLQRGREITPNKDKVVGHVTVFVCGGAGSGIPMPERPSPRTESQSVPSERLLL